MPFCTNCGTNVGSNASFCQSCGAAQPRPAAVEFTDILAGISNRTASTLCYVPVFGVIPAIIFLASQRYRSNPWVRFDAFQGLYLFVAWLLLSSAAPTLLFASFPGSGAEHGLLGLIKFALVLCWIYLLIKAAQNVQIRLPILGDLAARSATEQL